MRIAVSGTQCIGKTTFVQDFIKQFPMYKVSDLNYRKIIEEKGLKLNKHGNQESQEVILNSMLDESMKHTSTSNIIYDRCVLDNIVHTLWLKETYPDRVSDDFMRKCAELHKQATKFYDIIFFLPITKYDKIPIEERKYRDTDLQYREELNALFSAIITTYHEKRSGFFDMRDAPAIIEVFGSREERMQMVKFYINPETGNQFDEDDNLIAKSL